MASGWPLGQSNKRREQEENFRFTRRKLQLYKNENFSFSQEENCSFTKRKTSALQERTLSFKGGKLHQYKRKTSAIQEENFSNTRGKLQQEILTLQERTLSFTRGDFGSTREEILLNYLRVLIYLIILTYLYISIVILSPPHHGTPTVALCTQTNNQLINTWFRHFTVA